MQIRSGKDSRWVATTFLIALCLMTTFFTRLVSVFAASAQLRARTTLQRVVDAPGLGPSGSVELTKLGERQTFSVDVRNLVGTDYAVLYGTSMSTQGLVYIIAALDRGASNNTWRLSYTSDNGLAPPRLPVTDIEQMAGYVIKIGKPNPTDTNRVDIVLQAQVPPLSNIFQTVSTTVSLTPTNVPPNPEARGRIRTLYKESTGASTFEVRANRLSGGQTYFLFLEHPRGTLLWTNIAEMVLSPALTTASYRRDTKKGETLPLESATPADLSGRRLLITDAFGDIHLRGFVP